MDSGSDEEFFDAEDFHPPQDCTAKEPKEEPLVSPAESSSHVSKSEDVERENLPDDLDCSNILLKDKVIVDIQDDCGKSQTQDAQHNTAVSGVIETPKEPIKNTDKKEDDQKNAQEDQTTNHNDANEPLNIVDVPKPVAPPRRKKKEKKEKNSNASLNVPNVTDVGMQNTKNITMSMNIEMKQLLTDFTPASESSNTTVVEEANEGPTNTSQSTSSPVETNQEKNEKLTDEEILELTVIKNLDTGETMPLSKAKEKLPECTNPLALHIYKIASEQATDDVDSIGLDEEDHFSDTASISSGNTHYKRKKLKEFFGKTVQKIRSVADEVKAKQKEELSSDDEQDEDEDGSIKFKHHKAIKDQLMFKKIKLLQDLSNEHMGAVWTMKFSVCGKLLATAGQDNTVRIWVLKDYASHFEEMRLKYSRSAGRTSPTGSMTSSASVDDEALLQDLRLACGAADDTDGPFRKSPFIYYHGHTSDVLDLSWSKNYFLLSSSMDKTVRLWHVSRSECLCCFQHIDFVTAICFHPKDDRYFLSGSLDGKIRLWNIPEKKVALWNEIDGSGSSLITAANFCMNGAHAAVGTFDGRCIFYNTQELKYHTQVTVRSSRGKNARARKVSGIEPMPGEEKVLITTNDSRIRLYDLKDHSLYCKYKGLHNESSQIKASFNNDGSLILCGSEDKFVYLWNTQHDMPNMRKDRNEYYESFSAHDAVVTATLFAPIPSLIIGEMDPQKLSTSRRDASSASSEESLKNKPFEVLVAADWQGGIKLYINS